MLAFGSSIRVTTGETLAMTQSNSLLFFFSSFLWSQLRRKAPTEGGFRGDPAAAVTAAFPRGRGSPGSPPPSRGGGGAGPGARSGAERRALSVVLKGAAAAAPGLRPPANGGQDAGALTFNYVNPTFGALKLNRHRTGEGWGIIYCLVISLFCSCCSLGES